MIEIQCSLKNIFVANSGEIPSVLESRTTQELLRRCQINTKPLKGNSVGVIATAFDARTKTPKKPFLSEKAFFMNNF